MNRATLRQECCTRLDSVRELDKADPNARKLSFDQNLVVIMCRYQVPAIGCCNREEGLFVTLEIPVVHSARATEIGSADFHPDKVVCVIHHSHLIGFSITD